MGYILMGQQPKPTKTIVICDKVKYNFSEILLEDSNTKFPYSPELNIFKVLNTQKKVDNMFSDKQ